MEGKKKAVGWYKEENWVGHRGQRHHQRETVKALRAEATKRSWSPSLSSFSEVSLVQEPGHRYLYDNSLS